MLQPTASSVLNQRTCWLLCWDWEFKARLHWVFKDCLHCRRVRVQRTSTLSVQGLSTLQTSESSRHVYTAVSESLRRVYTAVKARVDVCSESTDMLTALFPGLAPSATVSPLTFVIWLIIPAEDGVAMTSRMLLAAGLLTFVSEQCIDVRTRCDECHQQDHCQTHGNLTACAHSLETGNLRHVC